MADAFKVLFQSKPNATTLTDTTAVPASRSWVVSSIVVCNQSAVATSFRISIAIAGAADTAAQYVYYDVPINGNDTFVATIGVGLATTDLIRVYNTLATLSFTGLGVEIT